MISLLRQGLTTDRWMAAGVGLQVVLAASACLGMVIDRREILGLNPWVKPFKFDVSVLILLVTMAVFLGGLQGSSTLGKWVGRTLAVSLTIENLLISLQALRGVRSHMNYTTPFDAQVFASMGILILVATVAIAVTLGLFVTEPLLWPRAVVWGVRLGLLMLLAGSIEGVVMVVHGGHTVGAADGLSGQWMTNWSREHGDLRIAHFFALHAVQLFPMLGYLCSRTTLGERSQVAAVCGGAALYALAVWLLFRQAMQGRALFS